MKIVHNYDFNALTTTGTIKIKINFTLIEMLVVIAIISILASMLMPAFISAQDSARGVLCANQCKQTGLAMSLYSDNNNDWFIPSGTWNSNPTPLWFKRLVDNGYIEDNNIFACPEDENYTLTYSHVSYGLNYRTIGKGYSNQASNLGFYTIRRSRLSRYPSLSSLIWLADAADGSRQIGSPFQIQYSYVYPFDGVSTYYPVSARHQSRCNTLFMDLHVSALDYASFKNYDKHWSPRQSAGVLNP